MENTLRGWQLSSAGVSQLQLSPPNAAFFCQLQSTKTQHLLHTTTLGEAPECFLAANKKDDVSLTAGKHQRRQTKWPLLIRKLKSPAYSTPMCLRCLHYPVRHAQFLPGKLLVKVVRLWWIVLNSKMQRVRRSNCTGTDCKWGKKVYTRCSPAKAEQSPHLPTTQETQNWLHFSNLSEKTFHVF